MSVSKSIKFYKLIHDISEDELARRLNVTTEELISWEKEEAQPNAEQLRVMSKEFDTPVNTILDSPKQLICQCCGMPLDDVTISKDPDGYFNEDYCKWCYTDGKFTYDDMETLIDYCVNAFSSKDFPAEKVREHMEKTLPNLSYWKNK